MDSISGITFKGLKEVVLVRGHDAFAYCPTDDPDVACYLAGTYAQPIPPPAVNTSNVSDLFGQFVVLRHNLRTRTLTILNDRFGLYPLYIAREDTRLYLGFEFHHIANQLNGKPASNYEALSDFLAFNVPYDRRTPLSAVEALGGGVELTIDLDTLSLQTRKTWHPATLLANADLHFDQVKDALVDLYLEGVELAVGSTPVRITLSGGADSRCLLAASLHLGKETTAYSTGIAGSRALSYASDMAARCGVPHVVRPLDNSFVDQLPALMLQCSKATQGMSLSSEVEALWLRQKLEPGGILLHGAFGELYKIGQMHQYPFDAATASKKGEALTDQLWQRFGKTYQLRKSGFNETYQSRIGDFARQHLSDKVKQYARGLDTAGVLQMFYIDEFIGKVVKSSGQMWRQSTPIAFPFAYPPLIDLILRVRPQQKTTNRFVAHLLARTNSQLGRYPDSNTGVRIGASRLRRQLTHAYDYATALVRPHYRCFDHQNFSTWLASIAGGPESMFHEFNEATGALDLPQVGRLIQRCRAGDDAAARTLFFLWRWSLAKIVLSTITGPSTSTTPTAPQHLPA
ncbi:asparagine synthase-related protein [Massilia sp. GCM10020059]|uniref:asparagine synthase (glutamine-hydrolyzing) n=1 Tax=Massilia agrisoli TaxID=2892444 RepID=A0ABS8IVC0_9BURK|nr:hypothetical protein [Massilia agrisoli]